jgi:hypothetical protein
VDKWPASFDRYCRGETQAVVVDSRIDDLIRTIVPRRTNPLADMGKVMVWVNDNFKYDHVDASLQASALHALEKHHGHCIINIFCNKDEKHEDKCDDDKKHEDNW